MLVRIFKSSKTATQSGVANSQNWLLEFDSGRTKSLDPLMGWTGSNSTQTQVRLTFDNKEEAIAYVEKNGLPYVVIENHPRKAIIRKNGYGENFATNRKFSWTH